jgi:hypothetical protein
MCGDMANSTLRSVGSSPPPGARVRFKSHRETNRH